MKSGKQFSSLKAPAPVQGKQSSLPYITLVIICTLLLFSGVSEPGWTNWDDDVCLLENLVVKEGGISRIFTSPVGETYNPLVLLSWVLEWKLVTDQPLLYHLNNLLLHVACACCSPFIPSGWNQ